MHGFTVPQKVPWADLDQRYFDFAASLPRPLDKLARDRRLFLGKGTSLELQSLKELHPLLTSLPWLFESAFPAISQPDVIGIGEAGALLLMGGALHDANEDGQFSEKQGLRRLHQTLMNRARQKISLLFEPHATFWEFFNRYISEYEGARRLEKLHVGQLKPYSLDEMFKIGSGKVALFKIVTTAIAFKGQREESIVSLEKAVDLMSAALQLGDDIEDWEEDYVRENYTLPLTIVIPTEFWPRPSLSVEEINELFDNSVTLEKLILQVIEWLRLSLEVVEELNCPEWVAFVESCLGMTKNYQEATLARKLLKLFHSDPAPSRNSNMESGSEAVV